jgi:hypothetical protein
VPTRTAIAALSVPVLAYGAFFAFVVVALGWDRTA